MDVRERLRTHADTVPTPERRDPGEVLRRGRRRRTTRRVTTGLTGVAVVALAIAVAWPGTGLPGSLVIDDEVADTPDDTPPEVPVLDLPDGWQQVEVAGAVFGIPDASGGATRDLVIAELSPDDTQPCFNGLDRTRAYLAADGYPPRRPDACEQPKPGFGMMLAAPLSTVPDLAVPVDGEGGATWNPRTIGPTDLDGETFAFGTTTFVRVPAADLWLAFHNLDVEPDLLDHVLSTVTPTSTSTGAVEPTRGPDPQHGDVIEPDLPEEWIAVMVGEAWVGVPPHLAFDRPEPDAALCPNLDDTSTVHIAENGYPISDCEARGGAVTSYVAASLSRSPEMLSQWQSDPALVWEPVMIGGIDGEVGTSPQAPDALRIYLLPRIDLLIEFVEPDRDPDLVNAVLATISPLPTAGAGEGADPTTGDDEPTGPELPVLDPPPGWGEGQRLEVDTVPGHVEVAMRSSRTVIGTDDAVTFALENEGDVAVWVGASYEVERWVDGRWQVQPFPENYGFPDVLEGLEPGSGSGVGRWPVYDGEEPAPGSYRASTEILVEDPGTLEEETFVVHTYFQVR